MKEAVEYLSSKDESYQHWGASYIQHNTFIDDKAKEDVGDFFLHFFFIIYMLYVRVWDRQNMWDLVERLRYIVFNVEELTS